MYRCPNEGYSNTKKAISSRNQLGKRFSAIFDVLLNSDYYEGTCYGRYFNEQRENGTSRIYVKDPLEKKLQEICDKSENIIKYLVGFTGMGKTTLLRNYFKVLDRDVHINDDNIIIYISFYYANLLSDQPQKSVENEVVKYLIRATGKLMKSNPQFYDGKENDDEFWSGLYDYIEKNKPMCLQNTELNPKISLNDWFDEETEKTLSKKKEELEKASEKNRLDYYSCLLKFVLSKTPNIHNVFLIYDDIEAKETIFHRPVVEIARHLHSCFSCAEDKKSWIKTFVVLRAYTFRSNLDRQLEARREQIEKNTIFKTESALLGDIFSARFDEIERSKNVLDHIKNVPSYLDARDQFDFVLQQINNNFSNIIYDLANCNVCNAMLMYSRILVNLEWIAKGETESMGSFVINAENYRLTAKTIFHALACGNEITYIDGEKENSYFPNILHNNGKEEGSELFNLLIIRYLIRKKATDLYGETYVSRDDIVNDISKVFLEATDSELTVDKWKLRIIDCLDYLYKSGILLRSIYDIETIAEEQIERQYRGTFKLYLSPRGKYLYNLFSKNALLLELYRDTIYTNIENNDKLTCNLRIPEIMDYLINYIRSLFLFEKRNIGDAIPNLGKYQEYFGPELLVSPLLEGVYRNIRAYYPDGGSDYDALICNLKNLLDSIYRYIDLIKKERGVSFCISNTFSSIAENP
jgi:hypothetical protein